MSFRTFAATARQATAVSRRGSIRALGGALIAGLTVPMATHAGKTGNQGRRRCTRQRG